MKFKTQLFAINAKEWKFEGRSGTSYQAQMLVTSGREDESGKMVEETFVARLKLPEHLKDTVPGEYLTELRPFADGNGMLDFAIVALVPLGKPAANGKPAAAVA